MILSKAARKAAALGLSTLILSSMGLPYALADELIGPQQPTQQTQPKASLKAEQPKHPIQARKRFGFGWMNPFAFLFKSKSPAQTAATIPVAPMLSAAAQLDPAFDINPGVGRPFTTIKMAPALAASAVATGAGMTEVAAPEKPAEGTAQPQYTQILPVAKTQPASQPAAAKLMPAQKIIQPKTEQAEAFQMVATSQVPTDTIKLKPAMPVSFPYPQLEAPDVTVGGGVLSGDATVLKSGISQKVSAVDLTIGKAEVVHLSRPASRVSISNPDVASAVIISPTQIQLIGKTVGVSNLIVWSDMDSHNHTIVDISVHRDVSVLINQLKYVDEGIKIVPLAADDTVILTGAAESRESAQLAIEMAKAFFAKGGAAGGANNDGPSSQAPGSAIPGGSTNVINLIKVKGEPSTKIELVRNRLNDIDPNIRIEVVPGPDGVEKVMLTGRVQTSAIASRALNLASVFYGQPGLKMITAQGGNDFTRMQVSSNSGGSSSGSSGSGSSSSGSSGSSNPANVLQGSVMTDSTGNVISMLEVAQKPQVRCTIKFLELNRHGLNALGGSLTGAHGSLKFSQRNGVQTSAPGRPISQLGQIAGSDPGAGFVNTAVRGATGNGWSPTTQTVAQAFGEIYQDGVTQVLSINNNTAAVLQAIEEKRLGRSLAEPTMTLMSGEQGSFLAGGEIPIAFLGGQGQISIQFHEYGIRLNLLPTVTDDGKVQMQVAPEVSTVDNTISVQGVPSFLTRRMQTSLLVEDGQAFVLAGLFRQDDVDSVSRLPGIGSLPIIGNFFRNKWKTKDTSELVVVIKPEIIMSNTGHTFSNSGANGPVGLQIRPEPAPAAQTAPVAPAANTSPEGPIGPQPPVGESAQKPEVSSK